MNIFARTAAAAAFIGAVALPMSANAWWGPWGSGGGPWSGMTDMFGDVDANFSSRGWGRGHGYGYPYYGYGYGPGYGGWGGGPWGGYGGGPWGYGGGPWGGYGGYPYGGVPAVVAPAAPAAEVK